MKSYLQGIITGGVLVFAIMVFMGSSANDLKLSQYKIIDSNSVKKFERQVNDHIEHGWKPLGDVAVFSTRLFQALVK